MIVQLVKYGYSGRIGGVVRVSEASLDYNLPAEGAWRLVDSRVTVDPATQYLDVYSGELVARPRMSLTHTGLTVAVGEALRITGIPPGTLLKHRDGELTVDDGYLEWSSEVPGQFLFILENFPFQREVLHAQVVA